MLIILALCIFALAYVVPLIGVLLASFKTNAEIGQGGLWAWPSRLIFENYGEAWTGGDVAQYLLNSFGYTIPATILSIALGSITGYVFSKLPFKYSNAVFLVVVAGMFFPPQIVLIPLFKLFNALGLYNTLWPMIIVHSSFGISICSLIMRNFYASVPNSLREAALIDGCTEGRVLSSIMLPLTLPALAVLGTLQFTWIWNDFLYELVFTSSNSARTVMVGLVDLQGPYQVAWATQAAVAVMASIPTMLIFLFLQRYFVRGLTMGAVKG